MSKRAFIVMKKSVLTVFIICIQLIAVVNAKAENTSTELTNKQARALQSLNEVQDQQNQQLVKILRLKITKLSDNQGQEYIGAIVSAADLSPYLAKLEAILAGSFALYRERQATRDHHLFHMTLVSPPEYQLADKTIIEKLLSSGAAQLNVTLLGLGKVALDEKQTFFIVAQSSDAQLLRQQLLLKDKDFHITLGFNPSDIYGVKKDSSTLIEE